MSTPSDVLGTISQLLQAQWSLVSPAVSDILWTDNKPDSMQFVAGSNKNSGVAVHSPSSPVSTRPLCRELWEITENVQIDIYVKVTSTVDAANAVRETIREECYRILHVNQAQVSGQQSIGVIRELQKVESPEMVRICLLVTAVSWDLRT